MESGIQSSESGIHDVESGIQDRLGFLYMGRVSIYTQANYRTNQKKNARLIKMQVRPDESFVPSINRAKFIDLLGKGGS